MVKLGEEGRWEVERGFLFFFSVEMGEAERMPLC
jgi:hypothetical protein